MKGKNSKSTIQIYAGKKGGEKVYYAESKNARCKVVPVLVNVFTTNKALFIYRGNELIGSASVINAKDFNYDALLKFALHKSGSKIDVA